VEALELSAKGCGEWTPGAAGSGPVPVVCCVVVKSGGALSVEPMGEKARESKFLSSGKTAHGGIAKDSAQHTPLQSSREQYHSDWASADL